MHSKAHTGLNRTLSNRTIQDKMQNIGESPLFQTTRITSQKTSDERNEGTYLLPVAISYQPECVHSLVQISYASGMTFHHNT